MRSIFVISAARVRRVSPTPRFRPDHRHQLDFLLGSPDEQVPRAHLARDVWRIVEQLDTSALESQYSSLGRRGFHPKRLLAVWVYASLIGLHHSTKLARACQTDAALRWLCGGDVPSAPTLRRMRMKQVDFFAAAIEQTIAIAARRGFVGVDDLAVDSLRVRAHAAGAKVRTVERSTKRLHELAKVDRSSLSDEARARHDASVQKHKAGLALCEARGVPSIVTTNPSAALMKFPSGASAPGHRVTVAASGASARFVVGVIIDAAPTDHGKLGPTVVQLRDTLDRLGLRENRRLTVAADAGYFSDKDLQFSVENKDWVDVLIPPVPLRGAKRHKGCFPRESFLVRDDGVVVCPAGRTMLGPYANDRTGTAFKWEGRDCGTCALRPQCTPGPKRYLQISPAKEKARLAMTERMSEPGAIERYNQRIATIEPVFSYLEDAMGYRRCSSRAADAVQGEILLKVLAYNIDRLVRAERETASLSCAFVLILEDGSYVITSNAF